MDKQTRKIRPKPESGTSSSSPSLDHIPASDDAPAKRRCISSACMPCRKRKSKCDGVQPSCNACLTVYNSSCFYDIDSDHRRKGALKRDIAQLKEEASAQNAILDALKKGSDVDIEDIVGLLRANPDDSYDTIAENIRKMSLGVKQELEYSSPSDEMEGDLTHLSPSPLACQVGNLSHYGHTSDLFYSRLAEARGLNAADQLGSWTTVTSDTEFINHLLDLYFAWSHPFYLLFSEELFCHGLQDKKLKHCTPMLVNVVLALGCIYSNRPEALGDPENPDSRGAHFIEEAKRLLLLDERSCLTTVQALGLMSIWQAKLDRDSPGWQFASRMMSMVIELGLHMQPPTEPRMTASEIEARKITFWGAFILQTAWSICVGRISSLPCAAIRIDKPSLLQHMTPRLWRPYGLPGYDGSREDLHQPSHHYIVLVHHSMLAELFNDVLHVFYAPQNKLTSRKLQHYHEKLQEWHKSLPNSLKINAKGPTTPVVFTLHMFYHNCIIQLFRPFLKASFFHNAKTPRQICLESANMISQLLNRSISIYGRNPSVLMQGHCIMSAGIIHLVHISSAANAVPPAVRAHSEVSLAEALRHLHAIQRTFPLMTRFLKALMGLTRHWCAVIPARVQAVLADSVVSPPIAYTQTVNGDSNINHIKHNGTSAPNIPPEIQPHLQYIESSSSTTYVMPLESGSHSHSHSHSVLYHYQAQPYSQHPYPISAAAASSLTLTQSHQQQLFWTPFPEKAVGVPLTMAEAAHHRNGTSGNDMSVAGMLGGEFPVLNLDGSMVEEEPANNGEGENGLWGGWGGNGYGS